MLTLGLWCVRALANICAPGPQVPLRLSGNGKGPGENSLSPHPRRINHRAQILAPGFLCLHRPTSRAASRAKV